MVAIGIIGFTAETDAACCVKGGDAITPCIMTARCPIDRDCRAGLRAAKTVFSGAFKKGGEMEFFSFAAPPKGGFFVTTQPQGRLFLISSGGEKNKRVGTGILGAVLGRPGQACAIRRVRVPRAGHDDFGNQTKQSCAIFSPELAGSPEVVPKAQNQPFLFRTQDTSTLR